MRFLLPLYKIKKETHFSEHLVLGFWSWGNSPEDFFEKILELLFIYAFFTKSKHTFIKQTFLHFWPKSPIFNSFDKFFEAGICKYSSFKAFISKLPKVGLMTKYMGNF